jgi:hypothetical protein
MFEPEIDRRCMSCGASVRKQAAFCPQCGQMLDQPNEEADESDQTEAEVIEAQQATHLATDDGDHDNQEQVNDSSTIQEAVAATEPLIVQRPESDGTEPSVTADEASVYKTQPLFTNRTLANASVASLAESKLKRSSTDAATKSDQRVLTRVDRIRKVSSVMIDQAAYDPSLRFLLVAGALFIVFVILMILSKVLG